MNDIMSFIIRKGFDSKESLPAKEWLLLEGIASTKRNDSHKKDQLPLKQVTSTKRNGFCKRNGFHLKLKTMSYTGYSKRNGFH